MSTEKSIEISTSLFSFIPHLLLRFCIINLLVCQMMHRLRRYDVFRFAQNDVAPDGRNDAMFAPMCPQAHIIRRSRHHWALPTSFAEGKHH